MNWSNYILPYLRGLGLGILFLICLYTAARVVSRAIIRSIKEGEKKNGKETQEEESIEGRRS